MTNLELLIGIRKLISDENRWTTGELARDEDGNRCEPKSPYAVCWCLEGAANKVWIEDDELYPVASRLDRIFNLGMAPFVFNDKASHKEVISLLDRKIEELRAKT